MRYYSIQISNSVSSGVGPSGLGPGSGGVGGGAGITVQVPATISAIIGAGVPGSQWTSVINGVNDPGALDIEIDIQIAPDGYLLSGWVKIYGIPQSVIAQSSYFTNCQLSIYGGFTDGLPLANLEVPHQGLLCNAQIYPCIGNWIGNELSITFFLTPSQGNPGGPTAPKNIIHNMPKGTPLSSAVQQALSTAFPGVGINLNISPNLTLNYDDHGFYQGLEQYMNYVKALSHSILGTPQSTGYYGVRNDPSKGPFYIYDGTVPQGAIPIQFEDLIGQPTWIDAGLIQIRTALRADIQPNYQIVLPNNILTTTTGGQSGSTPVGGITTFLPGSPWLQYQPGDVLNFQGTFLVISVRHIGRFRNPNAESNWVTIINALLPGATSGGITAPNQSGLQTFGPVQAAGG
jgi:hypothetical protein